MPCCWWSWVTVRLLCGSCAVLGLQGRGGGCWDPSQGGRVNNKFTCSGCQAVPVGMDAIRGQFAESPTCVPVPGVCSIPVCILQQKGCVLCASHRYTLSSQLVAVLDLEKNLAARGKGLAEASLPSNHPTETGAGALPLALEEKQMKMFSLGEAEVL